VVNIRHPASLLASSRACVRCPCARFLLLLFLFSAPARALVLDGPAIVLSPYAPSADLSNALAAAESLARAQHFRAAADTLATILTNAPPGAHAALAASLTPDGPLDMLVEATRLDYASRAGLRRDPLVLAQCHAALSNYALRAAGQRVYAYKMFIHRLIDHYHTVDSHPELYAAHEALIEYDPGDHQRVLLYLHTMLARKAGPERITNAWARYARLVPDSAEKAFCAAQIAALYSASVLSNVVHLMTSYTPRTADELRRWLDLGRTALRADDPRATRVYLDALGTAALRLPADDSAIELVALLLAERQKVELITAALTNAVPRSAP